MSETPEQIIPDEAIDSVWQGASFGPHLTEREVIRNTLLKFACGWAAGKTAHRIVAALGLAAINKQTLTKLGQKYLWACYSNGEFKDSPYQGSAGVWRSAAKPPGITRWYVVKCEQRRFASLVYVDSKITLERVAKDIDVEIDLLEWLDDSAASPAGDGWNSDLAKALDEYIKLLEDELSEVIGFTVGAASGWKSARYEKGMELRARINELKTNK